MDFLENILTTSLVLVGFAAIFVIANYFLSAKSLRRSRENMRILQENIKPGKKVLFSGGLVGRIVKAGEEYVDVELNKGMIITISRFAIQEIVE